MTLVSSGWGDSQALDKRARSAALCLHAKPCLLFLQPAVGSGAALNCSCWHEAGPFQKRATRFVVERLLTGMARLAAVPLVPAYTVSCDPPRLDLVSFDDIGKKDELTV